MTDALKDDEFLMKLALEEAARGIGATSPNPPVGAVIAKDGVILGKGWHRRAGMPHAEREALADAISNVGSENVKGATIFITLEPCSTHGRTPPCTDGLIEAGIRRVVYASTDPNPAHAGAANGVLAKAGIDVQSGVLRDQAERLIRPFAKVQRTGLPWVIWKTAMSLDGRLTRPPGEGMWLTGEMAREEVQRIRATVDAMVTSGETVRRDRPRLNLRDPAFLNHRDPLKRFVLTNHPDSLPMDAPLFTDEHRELTWVHDRSDIEGFLRSVVKDHGINSMMLECGGRLAGEFMDAGFIDEVVVFLAPILCGGDVPALAGKGFAHGCDLAEVSYIQLGEDIMMRGIIPR